jgi:hypothetical protein
MPSHLSFDHPFDTLYSAALRTLSLPHLPPATVRKAAEVLVFTLEQWPERWDERVERELACWVLEHLHHEIPVLALMELFLAQRGQLPASRRIVRVVLERAAASEHRRVLVTLLSWCADMELFPTDLEEVIVQKAVIAGLDLRDKGPVASILGAWVRMHPTTCLWARVLLREHPYLLRHYRADMWLFLLSPDADGARTWAGNVADGDPDDFENWQRLCTPRHELASALSLALADEERPQVREVLQRWLAWLE